jgi:hypothetical protein
LKTSSKIETYILSEAERQAVMEEINGMEIKTLLQRQMIKGLFQLSLENPGKFHHYSTFVERMYQNSGKNGLRNSNHINPLAKRLSNFLTKRETGNWRIILLAPKKIRNSLHWCLNVLPRDGAGSHNAEKSAPQPPSKPFLKWSYGTSYEGEFPVFLTIASKPTIFSIALVSKWQPPTMVTVSPLRTISYLNFKKERWRQKENANEQEYKWEGDTPICAFNGFKLVETSKNSSVIAVEASLAYYSDFRATNQLFAEWANSGEIEKIEMFKTGLGENDEKMHFHPKAVNPISVIVNLHTTDNKIVLYRPAKNAAWQSPATGFLDPFLDIQRVDPFNISPRETAIRMTTKRLKIPTPCQPIRWNGISRHHGAGGVTLLGEMQLGLSKKEVLDFFKKSKRRYIPLPSFLEFEPAPIVSFLQKNSLRFQHIFEVSLALSLSSSHKEFVTIGNQT